MKKNFAIILLFIFFGIFCFFEHSDKEPLYTVLEVIEGDKIVIDLNNNSKRDEDEVIHLNNISTFPLRMNEKAQYCSKRYGIPLEAVVSLGYQAKKFTEAKLLNSKVSISGELTPFSKNYSYRFGTVKFAKKDFAVFLLEEGLAFAYEGKGFNSYKSYENVIKIRRSAKEYFEENLVAVDNKYKIFHKTTCPKTVKIKEFELLLREKLPSSFKPCVYCFENAKENKHFEVKSPSKVFNNVKIFLIHPLTFDKPSFFVKTEAGKALLYEINSAKSSIDFALYGIDGQYEIIKALEEAKARGVKIRGVVDSKADGGFVYKDTKKIKEKFEIVTDKRAPYMHNKFFIFDKSKIFTGTTNISTTGTGGYNANTAILINDVRVASCYQKEFNQMFAGNFQNLKEVISLENLKLNPDTLLDLYFSPLNPKLESRAEEILNGAKKEIFVSAFYLTNRKIISALIAAKQRGVDVRVIYDAVGASNMKNIVKNLREAKVLVKVENWGGKNHEKNIEVDGLYFITGSANLSNSGYNKNDENVLIFKNSQIAGFYREHFMNLYDSIDNRYLKSFPRAESPESGNSCHDGIDNNFDNKVDSEDAACK